MTTLIICNWNVHFENNRTRELKKLDWVPVPNRHDGDGFTELLDHKNGMAHYAAWHLILQVASKCDPRGTLLRDGAGGVRIPHDAKSLARITRGDKKAFEEAIPRLISIGWIETYDDPAQIPQNPVPACGKVPIEGKGREGKGIEGNIHTYGEFEGVKLTDVEHGKLTEKHGAARLAVGIEILDDYMRSKGKRYKDHYAALKGTSWVWSKVDEVRGATKPSAFPETAAAIKARIEAARTEINSLPSYKADRSPEQHARIAELQTRIKGWQRQLAGD